ncbi:MAG TPA: Stk1 family PASTA domain-containing Ser/Thr kinase [Actinomycetota bacterium]
MTSDGWILSDRYELAEQLGAGGMAHVYLGRDRVLGRTVAVKTLLSAYAGDPQFIDRFRREAQHAAALNHPNIVSVYDTGADDGTHYIVMEFIEGRTLRDIIRDEGPLLPERAAEIASDVCAGLSFAHSHDIIHRDVKPANIMITSSGAVKVADFGIARAATGETVTQTAMVLGTAQYFSPEQAQSAPVDARSDVYSLGIVMYEMLTRQVPFTGSSPVAIAYKHVKEDPVPPSRLNPDVPAGLEAIVMKAMAKNPANRYQSADEMREDLQRALHGRQVEATPVLADATGMINPLADETVVIERTRGTLVKPPPTEEQRRRRTGLILLGVVIAAILGVAAWALTGILSTPGTVRVPDVRGVPLDQAEDRLEAAGLQVDTGTPVFSEYPSGTVAEQDPRPSQVVERGSTVVIIPSKGQETVRVPNVVGLGESTAGQRIERAGLVVGEVTRENSETVPLGVVIRQNPSGGRVEPETEVDLVVSLGRSTTDVPDVVGRSEEDARFLLEGDGFTVQVVEEEQSPDCAEDVGFVCRMDPEAGTRVTEGSTVTIFVATEPVEEPARQCNDGFDNDLDGFVDLDDPGCTNSGDDDESDDPTPSPS